MKMGEARHRRSVDDEQVHQLAVIGHERIERHRSPGAVDHHEAQDRPPAFPPDGCAGRERTVHPHLIEPVDAAPPFRPAEKGEGDDRRRHQSDRARATTAAPVERLSGVDDALTRAGIDDRDQARGEKNA